MPGRGFRENPDSAMLLQVIFVIAVAAEAMTAALAGEEV